MPPQDKPAARINPSSLVIPDAARLLTKRGDYGITVEMLRKDVEAGAPTNADGSLNLIDYAAWLIKGMAGGD